jgi:hypothetical protein
MSGFLYFSEHQIRNFNVTCIKNIRLLNRDQTLNQPQQILAITAFNQGLCDFFEFF